MEKNNYKMWLWIVIVIVLGAVLFFIFNNKTTEEVPPVTTNTPAVGTTEPASVQDTTKANGVGAVSISYKDALVKYADRRIQLDKLCQAHPNTVTYKDNTGIMIDNRSAVTQTVKLGTTFTIKPYGFKIVVLPDVYLKAKTLLMDCNKSQNVATVLVQE